MNSAIQIIDENKNFQVDTLKNFLGDVNGAEVSISPVVAVFGSQSSGKSTLLNQIFGTKFDVMSSEKRSQTTHGIWLALESKTKTLVLDVEGTDGRERGEDKDFERKAALFALSVADVLIVNIWENSIGLYSASNINLLRTVLDVYFEIYSSLSGSKTTLLFVIRDYVGNTPKSELQKVLKDELDKIWKSIEKPDGLVSEEIGAVFDVTFAFLPHKIFQPEDFSKSVSQLKIRFFNPDDEEHPFRSRSARRQTLIDFPIYAKAIWDIVVSNKSLDLPTQQELLAQHRCDEAIEFVSTEFIDSIKTINSLVGQEKFEEATLSVKNSIDSAKDSYHQRLQRFPSDIVSRKYVDLKRRFLLNLEGVFNNYCSKIHVKSEQLFDLDLRSNDQPFGSSVLKSAESRALVFFRASLEDFIALDLQLPHEDKLAKCQQALEEKSSTLIRDFLQKRQRSILKELKSICRDFCGEIINLGEAKWSLDLELKFKSQFEICQDEFKSLSASFSDYSFVNDMVKQLTEDAQGLYRDLLADELGKSVISMRANRVFESHFRYDQSGRPRLWNGNTHIDEIYDESLKKAISFVESVADYSPSEDFKTTFSSIDSKFTIITAKDSQDAIKVLKREAEVIYLDAKRVQAYGSSGIPAWVIILIIVLGWNEFVAIISSPLYLMLALMLISAIFVIHHLHLSGPLMTVINTIVSLLSTPVGQAPPNVQAKED